jgi:hypothetical protein
LLKILKEVSEWKYIYFYTKMDIPITVFKK